MSTFGLFFSFLFWCLIVVQSVVCNHYRYLWGLYMFEPLSIESVKQRMLTLGSHFPEKWMYHRKFKLLLFFFLQCYSVYKTMTCSLLFPGLNSLCSKITILFLISILNKKFDQMFFLAQWPRPHWFYVSISQCTSFLT